MSSREGAERTVRDIRRKTRKQYSAEGKIRIVLSGLRGEDSIAELCRREGIAESLYYSWSKEFLEAGKCPSSKHLGHLGLFLNGGSGSSWLMLSRLVVMGQAAFFDGQVFDLSPSLDDGVVPAEVDVGGVRLARLSW